VIDLWDSLFRTLSALAVVLGLMGLAALAAKRLLGRRVGPPGSRPLIQVLASGYVAPRKSIALVSVAGEYLIIGATATDLVPLGRISDAAKMQELLASAGTEHSLLAPSIAPSVVASWFQGYSSDSVPSHHGSRHEP
jgi:flagellar protein FliO/FliZ